MDLVVPTISSDVYKLINNIDTYFEYLPISKIVVVGSEEVKNKLPDDSRVRYINEDELISFSRVRQLIGKRDDSNKAIKRTGWYVQQFIKMKYSYVCEEEYYLLWDSDTVPLKKVCLMDDKIFLDCKKEYHKAYFDTISCILPGYSKMVRNSFICEHMVIEKKIMREMIQVIENNSYVYGEDFVEKIINSIGIKDLAYSGFSEFETYGTYAYVNYKERYNIRRWKSLRHGGFFYDGTCNMNEEDRTLLSLEYDAISFEKGDNLLICSDLAKYMASLFSPKIFEIFVVYGRIRKKIMNVFNS